MKKSGKFADLDKALKEYEASLIRAEKDVDDKAKKSSAEARKLANDLRKDLYSEITRWECIEIARHPARPGVCEFISGIFDSFMELHGDRALGDDPAITGGLAFLDKKPVVIIGHKKHTTGHKNYLEHHFGMASPSGNNKAARLMKLAEKFSRPVITFVDTPGAYPDPVAEDRGQAYSISTCINAISSVRTPVIACIIGEAGSGGALALGFGDRMIMLENAFYSAISPEGFASIKRGDETTKEEAAEILKGTGRDLYAQGLIDYMVMEPLGGAHNDPESVINETGKAIRRYISELKDVDTETLMRKRFQRIEGLMP
ncbi:MAG TPA: carboxyl transferase domain-containing protein [Desulfomonilia bacterium]